MTTTVTVTSKSSSGFDDFDPFSGGFTTTKTTTTTHTGSEDPFSSQTSGHRFDDQFADLMGGLDGSPRVEGGHEEAFRGSNGGGDFDHQHYSDQEGEDEYANLSEANYIQPDHYVEDDTYANHPSHLEGEGEDGIYEELHDGEGGHSQGYHDPHYLEPQAGGYQYEAEPVETGYDEAEYQEDAGYNQSGPGRGSSPDRYDQDHRASDGVTRTEVTQKSTTGGSVTTVRVISQRSGGSSGHREVSDDVTDQHMESRSAPHYYESSANGRSNTKYEQQHSDSKSPGIYFSEAADDNSCCKCGKRVYEMEKITADLMIYHKACFRCMKCNRILSLGNYASLDGRMYCKPHFIEIFKTKGNYGESFSQTSEPNKPVNAEGHHYTEQNDHADSRPVNRYSDNEDNDDDGSLPKGMKKEELPTVAIKSVRSMFEKMAVDTETGGQITPHKVSSTSRGATPSTGGGRGSGNRLVANELSGGRGSDVHDYGRGSSPSGSDHYNDQHDGDGRSGDVVQGSTTALVEEELPPVSMARNMVARFQQLQQDQGTASPAPVKHSTGHSGGASTGYGSTGGQAYKMPPVNYESPAASTANDKPVKTFKWQVKNDIPASRKGIVVGGDAARLRTPHNPQTSSRPSSESQDSPRGGSSSEADYSAYSHGSNDAYHDTGDQGAVHSEIKEEELPAPSTTRNLLQHFKSMEDVSKAPPTPQQATNPRKTTATPSRRVTEELDDRDGPVIKESDGLVEAELPAQGTTRNLMAMFQSGR